jgi:hypothetical protein
MQAISNETRTNRFESVLTPISSNRGHDWGRGIAYRTAGPRT